LIRSAFAKGRDLLRGNLLFSGLSDEDADAILASAHRTRYPARATIFAKGAPGQSMMAILQGRVRISVPSSEGREAVFKIMGEKGRYLARSRCSTARTAPLMRWRSRRANC
jgi:CRP-like cAMP-binding protein